jgi:hypothetical protein
MMSSADKKEGNLKKKIVHEMTGLIAEKEE